jgi:outer membrane protein assembly factor BamD (BamD/ComL family)
VKTTGVSVRKTIFALCLIAIIAGCQKAPQQQGQDAQRVEIARKLFAQGMVLLQQNDLKGAVSSLQSSIGANPEDPNAYMVLGQILIKAEQYDNALLFLDQSARRFPNNGTIFYMYSIANKYKGNKLPAILAARKSFELFKEAGDQDNIKLTAMLLQELIQEVQAEEANKAQTDLPVQEEAPKTGTAKK